MNLQESVSDSIQPIKPSTLSHQAHVEEHQHREFTHKELENAHEVLGLKDKPYLLLESDRAKLIAENHDLQNVILQHETSFLAPNVISNLILNNDPGTLTVSIGKDSNIQEVGKLTLGTGQTAAINIGEESSLAHAVKIKMPKGKPHVELNIGDNVFVGIGSILSNCTIGDHCSIGFKCRFKSDVELGDYVTVCDGCIVQKGLKIDDFTVVPPGVVVSKSTLEQKTLSPQEYAKLSHSGIKPVRVLIRFTEDEQASIKAAEEKEKGQGNIEANRILKEAGVDASSLFLTKFNKIVVSENRLFPLIYRLIEEFHANELKMYDRSQQAAKIGKNVMTMNLPKDREAFLAHYIDQVNAGIAAKAINRYSGEFTEQEIDWNNVSFEGNTYLLGPIKILGKTVIGQNFTIRGDEMGPDEKVVIESCTLGENNTVHASKSKYLLNVEAGNDCVVHGETTVINSGVGDETVMHNVESKDSVFIGNSVTLNALFSDTSLGERNTVIGHSANGKNGRVSLYHVSTGNEIMISHDTTIIGESQNSRVWLGEFCRVNQGCVINGQGCVIGDNTIFAPNTEVSLGNSIIKPNQLIKTNQILAMSTVDQVLDLINRIHAASEVAINTQIAAHLKALEDSASSII